MAINQTEAANVFDFEGAGEREIAIHCFVLRCSVGNALSEIWTDLIFNKQKGTISQNEPRH